MRWRLLRRRLSISAPRMSVRSHVPWPVRWAMVALMLGFSAALALWAFEFGKNLAGIGRGGQSLVQQVESLKQQLDNVSQERDRAQALANVADSLIKAERATQARLAEQVKTLEADNQALRTDLGFFEHLLPATGKSVSVRGLEVEPAGAGSLKFRLLVMQQGGRAQPEFKGRFELSASGVQDGKPWAATEPLVKQALQFKQYRRIEGLGQYPAHAVVKQVLVRVLDDNGKEVASQLLHL